MKLHQDLARIVFADESYSPNNQANPHIKRSAPFRGNTREAAMGHNRDPHSADWKGPHRFLVLRRDVGQGQIAIDCQAFLLRVATQ